MSEQQLETAVIMTIVSLGLVMGVFLIAVILTLRAKHKRQTKIETIKEESLNLEKRKNGKH